MEAADGVPSATAKNLKAIQDTLEDSDVIFIDEDELGPGVRLREPIPR